MEAISPQRKNHFRDDEQKKGGAVNAPTPLMIPLLRIVLSKKF